jgi:sec-independent protein translocase protein TatA
MLGLDQDLLVVLIIAALVFGSKKLPEIGKSLGQGIRELKDGLSGHEKEAPSEPKKIEQDTTDKKE